MSYKLIDFTELGGLHTWQDTFAFMQESYGNTLGQISNLIGNYVIVSGCELNQLTGQHAAGWVIIDGTIMPFVGGLPYDYVRIDVVLQAESFDDGTMKNVASIKRAIFTASAVGSIPFTSFKKMGDSILNKIAKMDRFISPFLPYEDPNNLGTYVRGSWLLWNRPAAEIPAGWEAVPDAELGDWKGRVPVIMDDTNVNFNAIGKVGGSETHTLTVNEIPSHNHTFQTGGDNALDNNTSGKPKGRQNDDGWVDTINTSSVGGGQAHNNLQPYKVVMFIRFIG